MIETISPHSLSERGAAMAPFSNLKNKAAPINEKAQLC